MRLRLSKSGAPHTVLMIGPQSKSKIELPTFNQTTKLAGDISNDHNSKSFKTVSATRQPLSSLNFELRTRRKRHALP